MAVSWEIDAVVLTVTACADPTAATLSTSCAANKAAVSLRE